MFNSCQNKSCINVEIKHSEALEKTEYFQMKFSTVMEQTQQPDWIQRIQLERTSLNITIEDSLES